MVFGGAGSDETFVRRAPARVRRLETVRQSLEGYSALSCGLGAATREMISSMAENIMVGP